MRTSTIGSRPVRWMVASLALGLGVGLLGSIAYAAIPGSGGVMSGCISTFQLKGQHALTGSTPLRRRPASRDRR
jgi:hypothetical protein